MLEWMKNTCLSLAFGFLVYKKNAFYLFAVAYSLCMREIKRQSQQQKTRLVMLTLTQGKKIWKWTFLYLTFSLLCIGLCLFSFETAFCKTLLLLLLFFSLPGKQLFEKDHNLDTSDIQFLEDGNISFNYQFFSVFIHPISKGY